MLTLGYKASAEQFGARELLEFRSSPKQVGFDSVVRQRPLPALAAHRRPRAVLLRLAGRARRAHQAGADRHQRGHPHLPLPPLDRRPGDGHDQRAQPGRVMLGVGTGESLNEMPSIGIEWPEFKERFGRLREAVALMRRSGARTVSPSRPVLPDDQRHHLRPAGRAAEHLRGRRRRGGRAIRGPRRRRLHLHQRQEAGPLHRDPAAERRRGGDGRRPAGRHESSG